MLSCVISGPARFRHPIGEYTEHAWQLPRVNYCEIQISTSTHYCNRMREHHVAIQPRLLLPVTTCRKPRRGRLYRPQTLLADMAEPAPRRRKKDDVVQDAELKKAELLRVGAASIPCFWCQMYKGNVTDKMGMVQIETRVFKSF